MNAFIDQHSNHTTDDGLKWGVEPICAVLPISPATYFFFSSRRRHTRYWLTGVQTCALPISPLYASLCRLFAREPRVGALADRWEQRVPLLVLAGLHYLVLGGNASWDAVDDALEEHADFLRRFVAEQPVQTNEVQRCWVLLPPFLHAVGSAEVH